MAHILAFESFDGGSHKQFRETLTRHSSHSWEWITRPARSWKWRLAISANEMVDEAMRRGVAKPDGIFVTSMTDSATLRSILPNGWRDIPLIVYMHENQAEYPTNDERDASFAITNFQSIMSADLTIFNSKWNLDSFIIGIEKLLKNSTDLKLTDIEQRVRNKSTVAWIPVELPPFKIVQKVQSSDIVRVVWPHRWEHDKRADLLLDIARKYTDELNLRWIILGEQFKNIPEPLLQFKDEFHNKIEHMGYVQSKIEYWDWLSKADWVLSTAEHEFFGIAVVEALFANCLPWLPEKLSYRELLPACARNISPGNPPDQNVVESITDHLYMAQAMPATKRIDSLITCCLEG